MSNLLQTVIPAAVTFLVGYQGALTRTGRRARPADRSLIAGDRSAGASATGPTRMTLPRRVRALPTIWWLPRAGLTQQKVEPTPPRDTRVVLSGRATRVP
jgi:hypothetical protein